MTSLQAGLISEDARTHVVTLDNGTQVARCGRGTITRRLPGEFRPGDPLNCPDCERLAA